MKQIKLTILLSLIAIAAGCVSKHYADTGTDRVYSDPVVKIGDGVTPEQAKEMQGRTIHGPKINLFGGNLSFGIFEYSKGLTAQYESEEFSYGGASFSKTAANGLKSTVSYRDGKSRGFDVETIESEAHTKEFFDGITDVTKAWLEASPAGQLALAKDSLGAPVTDEDLNQILSEEDIPDSVRSELESLRSSESSDDTDEDSSPEEEGQ